MNRLHLFLFGLPAVLAFAMNGAIVSPAAAQAASIKVGCVAALSGPAADIGNRLRDGAELAIANMKTINGRPIELVVRDSKGDPSVAQRQVENLISEGIVGLVCVSLSSEGAALSAASKAGRLDIPTIQSSAVADEITGAHCNAWTFRTVPTAGTISRAVQKLRQSDKELLDGGWYTLASDYLYGRSSAKAIAATPGIKIVGESFAPLDTTDWTPYLNKIVASGAKALWLPVALGAPYVQLMTQANNLGLVQKIKIFAPTGLPQEFVEQLGDSGIGINEPASAVLATEPGAKVAVDAYFAAHKKAPSEGVLQSYVGTSIMLQAIKSAAKISPEGVRDALQKGTFDTLVGQVRFRPGDQQIVAPLWAAKVEKLATPVAGAGYGFKATHKFNPDDVMPKVEETGCKAAK
ncbi:MAG: ABC transporter substrate-binding protein [Hyphomicrobiaceae bacterium]